PPQVDDVRGETRQPFHALSYQAQEELLIVVEGAHLATAQLVEGPHDDAEGRPDVMRDHPEQVPNQLLAPGDLLERRLTTGRIHDQQGVALATALLRVEAAGVEVEVT